MKKKDESISLSEFARRLGVVKQHISALCVKGILKKNSEGKLNYQENLKLYMDARDPTKDYLSRSPVRRKLAGSNLKSGATQTLASAKLYAQNLKNKKLELELKKADGELIPLQDVRSEFREIAHTVSDSVMNIGARIAPLLVMKSDMKEIRTILDNAHREALEVLGRGFMGRK